MNTIQIPRRFVADPWGGTETVVLETSKRLIEKGHPTEIYTSMAMSDRPSESIEGVPVRRFQHFYPYLGLGDGQRKALDFKAGNLFSFDLWQALSARKDADVLHLHTGKRMGGIVRTVAAKRGIPYVLSLHGGLLTAPATEVSGWTDPTKGCFEWGRFLGAMVGARSVVESAAAIVCVSRAEAESVSAAHPSKRVVVLPNGVDPDAGIGADGAGWRADMGIPPDASLLLLVGRIDPQKGQLHAIRALATLRSRFEGAHLVIIGGVTDPAYCDQLREEVASGQLEGRVHIVPGYPRGDRRLWQAFAAADIVLVPSRHEPFGIVVLEAWSMGKPVVASAVGGLLDLVQPDIDGLLVPPENSAELAAHVGKLLENPGLARSLGEAGRQKAVCQYSWEAISNQLIDLYEEVRRAHRVRP